MTSYDGIIGLPFILYWQLGEIRDTKVPVYQSILLNLCFIWHFYEGTEL